MITLGSKYKAIFNLSLSFHRAKPQFADVRNDLNLAHLTALMGLDVFVYYDHVQLC